LVGLISPVSAHGGRGTIYVWPGQAIQAAIDAAHSRDRIVVEAGTYAEQLTIVKDGIALIGRGAILVPLPVHPDNSKQNTCSGLAGPGMQAGICVYRSEIKLANFVVEHRKVLSVGRQAKDISITSF
jgi:pectin methylesterase-like acyl-CoA thioesterase